MILGNLILGIGITILRFSQMGNDPFCASTMAISEGLGMGLGTIVNLFLMGYIIQFGTWVMESIFGADPLLTLPQQFLIMVAALVILTFGLAMYQVAELGVAPYDFLALGLAERFPIPYFALRVGTDAVCVLVILGAVGTGLIGWDGSHLGIGTVITTFFLGPLVAYFSKLHEKWVNETIS